MTPKSHNPRQEKERKGNWHLQGLDSKSLFSKELLDDE